MKKGVGEEAVTCTPHSKQIFEKKNLNKNAFKPKIVYPLEVLSKKRGIPQGFWQKFELLNVIAD